MNRIFAPLRSQSTLVKASILFVYALLTFLAIYFIGHDFLGNAVFFRVFELLWFLHMLIICNQVQQSQRELFIIALIAVSPGIVNNLIGILELRG
nr:hypothetical protein [Oscillochloris trichoides]